MGEADAPLYSGDIEDLKQNFNEICSSLPITHTDFLNCDELVDNCSEKDVLYDMLKITPRKGDAVLFMPVSLPESYS